MNLRLKPTNTSTSRLGKMLGGLVVVCVLALASTAVQADQIKLNARANVKPGEVKLKDIAELTGTEAQTLGEIVLGKLDGDSLTIALSDVRSKLNEKGVNWGRLSLRGFMQCQVNTTRQTAAPVEVEPAAAAGGNVVANPAVYVASDTILTVGDRVIAQLVTHAGLPKDDLRIVFGARDQDALKLSILKGRWEVEPLNSAKIGRVLVTVRQWEGDRIINTYRLTADISQRALCVVALRDIKRSEIFAAADIEIHEVYLDQQHQSPASDVRNVIGMVAKLPVDKGQLVMVDQIARQELIKRGDRLSVRCIVGGMVIKTMARAMESGAMGDSIVVANMDSNERFTVRITGSKEAILSLSKPEKGLGTTKSTDKTAKSAASESPVNMAAGKESRS